MVVDRLVKMVRVDVPVGLVGVRITLPIGESVGGCFAAGRIVAERTMVPVNPLMDATVIVRSVEEPLAMEVDAGLMVSWKLADWLVMVFDATGVVWYGLS